MVMLLFMINLIMWTFSLQRQTVEQHNVSIFYVFKPLSVDYDPIALPSHDILKYYYLSSVAVAKY